MALTVATNTDTQPVGPDAWLLAPGAVLFDAGDQGGFWRVRSGVVRLDRPSPEGPVLAMLALAGDWLGADSLCGQPHPWRATAVTPVLLQRHTPTDEAQRQRWIVEALLQQPERCHDMARLRTGPVAMRLSALLRLLGVVPMPVFGAAGYGDAPALPPLRVMADLVDAKTETVCRVLGKLLPRRGRARAAGALASTEVAPSELRWVHA